MTPDFLVKADGSDITHLIRDRLLSIEVSDEAGIKSDSLEIRLDDRGGVIELPRKGAGLDVSLGYKGQALTWVGYFTVDEIELSGAPDTLIIKGRAADMRAGLKEKKNRSWDEVTLGDLVSTIASEQGLSPAVGEFLDSIFIPHLDQTIESDLHLLTRLARQYDAVSKPIGQHLLFVPKGEAKSATGRSLPTVSIRKSQCSTYRVVMADRGKYKAVIAHWHNSESGKPEPVRVGESGKPVKSIRHPYFDAETAKQAAVAHLESLKRGDAQLSLDLADGDLSVGAESPLVLSDFRDGFNGKWVVTRAIHTLSGRLMTRLEAEPPKV